MGNRRYSGVAEFFFNDQAWSRVKWNPATNKENAQSFCDNLKYPGVEDLWSVEAEWGLSSVSLQCKSSHQNIQDCELDTTAAVSNQRLAMDLGIKCSKGKIFKEEK